MSTLGDALAALKNAVLLQERLDVVRRELVDLSSNVRRLDERVINIDRRVVRIETMIEMSGGGRPTNPRIEG